MVEYRLKKSLGQNFLIDENIARKVIKELHLKQDDIVLEIGPGKGALTKYLKDKVKFLIAVEIDKNIITHLNQELDNDNIEIVHGDILKIPLVSYAKKYHAKLRVVGNIPYHLTSPIIFKVLDEHKCVSDLTIMVQREVALRITAKPNSKDYGILSVLTQYIGSPRYLFTVSENCFYPPPKVKSAVIQIPIIERDETDIDEAVFRIIVKTSFGKRRKTLRNSLKFLPYPRTVVDNILSNKSLPLDKRPENLTVKEFTLLTRQIQNIVR